MRSPAASDNPVSRPPWLRAVIAVLRVLVTVAVLAYNALEAIFAPFLRPIWRWLGGLTVFRAIGAWIGRQHPYVVLVLVGVPFLILEPAKAFAVFWAAAGHPVQGAILLIVGEILTVLGVERIFHVGYEPLMRIGWFKRLMTWLLRLRDNALAWAHTTALWQAAWDTYVRVRDFFEASLPHRRG